MSFGPVDAAIMEAASAAETKLQEDCRKNGQDLAWSERFSRDVMAGLRESVRVEAEKLNASLGSESGTINCELQGLTEWPESRQKSMDWIFSQGVSPQLEVSSNSPVANIDCPSALGFSICRQNVSEGGSEVTSICLHGTMRDQANGIVHGTVHRWSRSAVSHRLCKSDTFNGFGLGYLRHRCTD